MFLSFGYVDVCLLSVQAGLQRFTLFMSTSGLKDLSFSLFEAITLSFFDACFSLCDSCTLHFVEMDRSK